MTGARHKLTFAGTLKKVFDIVKFQRKSDVQRHAKRGQISGEVLKYRNKFWPFAIAKRQNCSPQARFI
jgi:hypothetical protein